MDERRADQRWRTAVLAVGGLLIAIAIIGVAGIVINRNIHHTVEEAIAFDVELEDRGDDLRVAILEVRHYHRDLLLNNPDATRVELWRGRYQLMIEEIDAVDRLLSRRPGDADLPDVRALRSLAEAYYADFTDALTNDITDRDAFQEVAEDLLVPINEMEAIAIAVDRAGEIRAAAAFQAIDDASATGTLVLIGVIAGLGAMGAVLAFAVLRLVQDQRRLVAAEQAAAAQMAETSRAKTDFIADASHELRTPLTVLRGNAEVGLAIDDDCAHAEILSEIVAESARMSRLVDDLLFLARSDVSSVPLDLRDVEAGALLDELAGRAEVLARERGASLEARIHGAGGLRADPDRVEQAVLILVDNAAKYGPSGGTVQLEATVADGSLVVEVRDRGPGIPSEQIDRIFERFYRADGNGRERSSGGVGLGLSIAAAIAEGHGGRIEASHRDGGGTVMRMTLPLRTAAAPVEHPA
ncbi:MAG TPA: ATP-binding protein [Candidatus Limnocylindrales bacterium]|nr:ATP-binding protein [Candidatus Limnocylindrales bacterium]